MKTFKIQILTSPTIKYIYIYIYACLEEVDFIVCDCFLSNPFFSYELGIFTWQSMYFQCTCFYSGYKKSLMKWQVVTHFSYIHRNLSSQLTLDHICENDDQFSRNAKLKHLAWGTNQSWIILSGWALFYAKSFFDWRSICRHTRDMSFRVCGRARVLGYEQQLSCYSRWYFLGHEFVSYWVRLTGWLALRICVN